MRPKKLLDYLTEFDDLGKLRDEASINGDYKSGNKAYKKMEKIFELAKRSDDKEVFYLNVLNIASCATSLTTCSAHMMRLNIYPELARKKLEDVANSKEYHPILTFNAEMFLKEWDKGNIKPIE